MQTAIELQQSVKPLSFEHFKLDIFCTTQRFLILEILYVLVFDIRTVTCDDTA